MRVIRMSLALGALCVAGLAARPALAQQGPQRIEQGVARESWHEARRREALERRAALLEWHRARRAGVAPRPAARAGLEEREDATAYATRARLAERNGAAHTSALRTASVERRFEPAIVAEPESRVRVLGSIGIQEDGRAEGRGFERDRFEHGRDRFRHGRGRHGFGRDPWGAWGVPFDSFGLPRGFEDLVCVARVRDPFFLGGKGFGRFGRADGIQLRATCLPTFPFGFGWVGAPFGAFWPYGLIGDPLLLGFPFHASPWPVPHRFSHRFFPSASALPWPADDAWLLDDDEDYGFEGLVR